MSCLILPENPRLLRYILDSPFPMKKKKNHYWVTAKNASIIMQDRLQQ
jgi:hypothetical protein